MSDPTSRLNAALSGRYLVERELGEGGMATVYLADDLKLERKVALKVLKPELAAVVGAERFLAEIKTTANLQHPHILPLHDSGEADSLLFYVMPYVEGESLRETLNREKQLPVEEAVRIATEVADALDHAHRRGVIHRDVKPENVLLQDGRVLVADFGIALAVHAGGGARLTETGLSLGTPAYMSPEQATGDREVDGRTDLYSLGCLLYEMLSGEAPHSGSTAQAILASILTQNPRPLIELRETTPNWLAALTHRALARLPADRFADASSMRSRLLNPGKTDDTVPTERATRGPQRWPRAVATGFAGLVAGLLLGPLILGERSPTPRATYVPVALPEDLRVRSDPFTFFGPSLTISPDAREVVFVGESDGRRRLYRLSLDAPGTIEPIAGTESGQAPFYSPNGEWIGFTSMTRLMKVPAGGGTPTELAPVVGARGGAWSPDNEFIYFVPAAFTGVWRISADGGEAEEITRPLNDAVEVSHMWPAILPNGDLLFTSCCSDVRTFLLEAADPEGTPRPLMAGGGAQYVPSGHLVFMQRTQAMIAAYDVDAGEVGPPEQVHDGLITGSEWFAEMAISLSGTFAYLAGRSEFDRPLMRIYPDGSRDSIPVPPASHAFPLHFSPDGRRLLYASYDEGHDLFAYDVASGRQPRRLTTHPSNDYSPIWGPGASNVTFSSLRDGHPNVYTLDVESGGEPRPLLRDDLRKWPLSWTADGAWLIFGITSDDTGEDLWVYSAQEDSAWAFLDQPYNEFPASFKPSGDWIAYARDDAGRRREVWAVAFPDGVPCPVSIGGGTQPVWSSDGARLYYTNGDTLMVAEAPPGGSICDARPRPHVTGMHAVWGLAPDESYVVTVTPPPEPQLRLVIDWESELRGRGRD